MTDQPTHDTPGPWVAVVRGKPGETAIVVPCDSRDDADTVAYVARGTGWRDSVVARLVEADDAGKAVAATHAARNAEKVATRAQEASDGFAEDAKGVLDLLCAAVPLVDEPAF